MAILCSCCNIGEDGRMDDLVRSMVLIQKIYQQDPLVLISSFGLRMMSTHINAQSTVSSFRTRPISNPNRRSIRKPGYEYDQCGIAESIRQSFPRFQPSTFSASRQNTDQDPDSSPYTMDQARRGATALDRKDFAAAVSHYTEAISQHPQAVDYYIKRSTAYTRLSPSSHDLALSDAEIAVSLATKRAKRELIAQAQLRRGIALFGLERWADSRQCFQWVKKLNEKEKSLAIWEMKIDGKMRALEHPERQEVSIQELPEVELPKAQEKKKAEKMQEQKPPVGTIAGQPPEDPAPSQTPILQTPPNKIRHEWYQQNDTVIVTLFAKGIPKDKATVEIKPASLEMSFPLPTGSTFDFSLDPLFYKIDHAASSFKIMSTKAEFTLKKATPGQKWPNLEGSEPTDGDFAKPDGDDGDAIKRAVLADGAKNSGPAYPTSAKTGPKDWDKVASDLTKKPKKDDENGEEGDDDVNIDDEEGDPVNGFFKKLYKGADEDTRRAMMKSYQESNGTALSTNWSEVGKGKVETTPPDGMEARPW